MQLGVTKLEVDFFHLRFAQQNSPTGSYYHLLGRAKLLIPQGSIFWKSVPPIENGKRKEAVILVCFFSSVELDDDVSRINEEDPEENKRHVNGKLWFYEVPFSPFLYVFLAVISTSGPHNEYNFFLMCI